MSQQHKTYHIALVKGYTPRTRHTVYPMFRKTPAFRRGDIRNGFDFDLALYSE